MLLSKFVQHRGRDLVLVRERLLIRGREMFFVQRKRRLVDGRLRLLKIGLCSLQNLFHWQIGREGEAQFFAVLLGAETEIAVRAGQQIVLQPFLVILQRGRGFFLDRREVLLYLRRLIEQWREL